MKIQVIERESEKTLHIDESAFDDDLHIRVSDAKPEDVGTITADGLREQLEVTFERFGEKLGETLGNLSKPKRGRIQTENRTDDGDDEEYDEGTRAAFGAGRTRAAAEAQYIRLPEAERAIRSYESDVMCHRWLIATHEKDHEARREIERSPAFNGGQRGHTVGTDAEGGYLAPQPIANFIAMKRDAYERVAPNSISVTSVSTTLDIPLENAVGAVAAIAEAGTITPSDSTVAQLKLTKEKVGRIALISEELLMDQSASFSIVNLIGQQSGRKLGVFWDTASANATAGGGVPSDKEINNTNVSATTFATAGTLTRAECVKALLAVPTAWRDGGGVVCMGNSTVTSFLSELEDANGRPIYDMASAAAIPVSDVGNATGNVEGVPYLEIPFDENRLLFGNLNEGFVVMRDGGLRINTSSEYAFNSDQVAVRVLERRASGMLQEEAFSRTPVITATA